MGHRASASPAYLACLFCFVLFCFVLFLFLFLFCFSFFLSFLHFCICAFFSFLFFSLYYHRCTLPRCPLPVARLELNVLVPWNPAAGEGDEGRGGARKKPGIDIGNGMNRKILELI